MIRSSDYTPIGSTAPAAGVLEALSGQAAPLFNGNIAAMLVNINALALQNPGIGDARVYNYHYDQLNRMVAMDAYKGVNMTAQTFDPVLLGDDRSGRPMIPMGIS